MATDLPEPPAENKGLGRQVRKGLQWSMVSTVVTRGGNLLFGVLFAHLLAPEDFGVFAIAVVALNLLLSMNELGVSVSVIRYAGKDVERVIGTAFTLALGTSLGFYAVCFLAAPWFSTSLHAPQASGVLRLLCLAVVIDGASSVSAALLTRAFLQDRRALAEFAALAVSGALTVFLAVTGHGVWSLAWGRLAGNIVAASLLYGFAPLKPRPCFRFKEARELVRVGLPLAGASLMVLAVLNVDNVVVGRALGPVTLGFYVLAFNVSSWPANLLSVTVRPVSIAGFSKLSKDPENLQASFIRGFTLLMALAIPVTLFLAVLAPPLVRVLYGPKWSPAIVALRYLAILGGIRVAFDLCYDVFVAAAKPKAALLLQTLWVGALIPALALGAHLDGIRGVAIAHVAVALMVVAPFFVRELHRLGIRARRLAGNMIGPVLASLLAGGVALALQGNVSGDFVELVSAGLAGGCIYLGVMFAGWRDLVRRVVSPVRPPNHPQPNTLTTRAGAPTARQ